MTTQSIEERFWAKVDKRGPDECWLWKASTKRHGYGQLVQHHGGPNLSAHRFSWELHRGPIPEGDGHHGTCVLHRCDNPPCVNPRHLFLGSQGKNMDDMKKKGRANKPHGESHPRAKLTNNDVRNIRATYAEGDVTMPALALFFDVSQSHICEIITRNAWPHVE